MINKIKNIDEMKLKINKKQFRITIENLETGEIVYQNESYAGIVTTMENKPIFQKEMINGQEELTCQANMQKLAWGSPILALTCLDQAKQSLMPKLKEALRTAQKILNSNSSEKNKSKLN